MSGRTFRSWMGGIGLVVGFALVGGIMHDLWRASERNAVPDREALRRSLPRDVVDPRSGVVLLEGAARTRFLRGTPLTPGSAAPRLSAIDFLRRPVSIPDAAGRPSACAVSCGCQVCAAVIDRLYRLQRASGFKLNSVALVATRSHYVWGHHANSYMWKENFRLLQDQTGALREQMRPSGSDPTRLPFVWGCDAAGTVRYAAQPAAGAGWVRDLQVALGIKLAAIP